jgi:D-alanyl-lipoteichoic acid acyltransferase DltB (MBOAT superfamily)
VNLNINTLHLLVPIGISFFTFKTISYLLDVNKGKIAASNDAIIFFTYVSFFPTILSGPIDRARGFIPQLESKREFLYESAMTGLRQIFWGLFKKVVVADTLSVVASEIFKGYSNLNSITLILGSVVFSIQLYADFCGYSDMAIGISKLLGFNVVSNFNYPFFADNIADFWRRWHMSLTSWLTEYVFTPLSIYFRDYGKFGVIISIVINFVICGIWHGANWTFVLWGFLHGCYFIPLIIKGTFNKKKKKVQETLLTRLKYIANAFRTFFLVSFTLVLFRADSISDAIGYYKRMFNFRLADSFQIQISDMKGASLVYVLILFCLDLFKYNDFKFVKFPKQLRFVLYLLFSVLILVSLGKKESFIYFKF